MLIPDALLQEHLRAHARTWSQVGDSVPAIKLPSRCDPHPYISAATFGATYGASPGAYQNVVSWVQSYSPSVTTFPNNLVVDSQPTAGQIQAALFVNLVYALRPDGTTFYTPDRVPTFTAPTGPIALQTIHGVDNFAVPRPLGSGGTSPGGWFDSSDLRTAYLGAGSSCAGLTGAGQTIGIVAHDGYTLAQGSTPGDIENYESSSGLTGVPPVVPVLVNTPNNQPIAPDGSRGSAEAALDLEMAIAMAPGATVIPFQGPDIDSILSAMAATPGLFQASSSYTGADGASQVFIDELAAQGVSFFMGSGDGGAYAQMLQPCSCACQTSTGAASTSTLSFCPGTCATSCGPSSTVCGSIVDQIDSQGLSDLRSLDHLTLVGGTQLTTTSSQAWFSETTWGGSGGGVITNLAIPKYQRGLANLASLINRNSPDVAMPAAGVYVVVTGCNGNIAQALPCPAAQRTPGTQGVAGGTSASGPLWAGFTALVNEQGPASNGPIGFANPLLYQIANQSLGSFHNIADGSSNTNGVWIAA